MTDTSEDYAVVSELEVPDGSGPVLEAAFADRLGEVEEHEGFRRLEVWRDVRDPNRYLMVTWWRSPEDFTRYMRSDAHRRSHARIPAPPHKPRARSVRQYEIVAR